MIDNRLLFWNPSWNIYLRLLISAKICRFSSIVSIKTNPSPVPTRYDTTHSNCIPCLQHEVSAVRQHSINRLARFINTAICKRSAYTPSPSPITCHLTLLTAHSRWSPQFLPDPPSVRIAKRGFRSRAATNLSCLLFTPWHDLSPSARRRSYSAMLQLPRQ